MASVLIGNSCQTQTLQGLWRMGVRVCLGFCGGARFSTGFLRFCARFCEFLAFFFVKVSIGFPEGFVVGLFVAGSVRFGSRCA